MLLVASAWLPCTHAPLSPYLSCYRHTTPAIAAPLCYSCCHRTSTCCRSPHPPSRFHHCHRSWRMRPTSSLVLCQTSPVSSLQWITLKKHFQQGLLPCPMIWQYVLHLWLLRKHWSATTGWPIAQRFIGLRWVSYIHNTLRCFWAQSFLLCVVIVLHPRHKLTYFQTVQWSDEWIKTAESLVCDEFEWSYNCTNESDIEIVESDAEDSTETVKKSKVCSSHGL